MERFHIKSLTLFISVCVVLHSVTGCGSSNQAVNIYSQYDTHEFSEEQTFNAAKETVFTAALRALENRGYVLTLSDPVAGIMTAEHNTENILPEERQTLEHQQYHEDHSNAFLTFLGIILFVGILAKMISSSHEGSEDQSAGQKSCSQQNLPIHNEYGLRYTTTISLTTMSTTSTVARISVIKMELENGTVKNSFKLYNKYLNYFLFDEIHLQVNLAQR